MKLPEAAKSKLYEAIHEGVMELRVKLQTRARRGAAPNQEELDRLLHDMVGTIHAKAVEGLEEDGRKRPSRRP